MSKKTAPFDMVPDQYLQDWIGASLFHPVEFGGEGTELWGTVQMIPGDMTYDAWGYLAKLKGYNGHVGMPIYSEAKQLWARAGYSDELTKQEWEAYTKDYVYQAHTKDEWLDVCRIWFGSDNVAKVVSDE